MSAKTYSKVSNVTYFGRKVRVATIREGRSLTSARNVYMLWVDSADERNGGYAAGTITHHWIKGDGRSDDSVGTETKIVDADELPEDVRKMLKI